MGVDLFGSYEKIKTEKKPKGTKYFEYNGSQFFVPVIVSIFHHYYHYYYLLLLPSLFFCYPRQLCTRFFCDELQHTIRLSKNQEPSHSTIPFFIVEIFFILIFS